MMVVVAAALGLIKQRRAAGVCVVWTWPKDFVFRAALGLCY
jgi:hypothetical protein